MESDFGEFLKPERRDSSDVLSQRLWWEVLFFIHKLSSEVRKQAYQKIADVAQVNLFFYDPVVNGVL